MKVRVFTTSAEFLAVAAPFLLRDEAAHNLMLGHSPQTSPPTAYLAVVEREGEVVVAAAMTPPRNLIVSRCAEPAALRLLAEDLAGRADQPPGVHGPADESFGFATAWHELTGAATELAMAERIYALDRVVPVAGVPGRIRQATEADRPLLFDWMAEFAREALPATDPSDAEYFVSSRLAGIADTAFYLWEDPEPVSVASTAGPTPQGIKIGPVYTPPRARRRGYASALVAALSQLQLDRGRRWCFLYTDLANPTSNHIYQAIGFRPVCDVHEYRFSPTCLICSAAECRSGTSAWPACA